MVQKLVDQTLNENIDKNMNVKVDLNNYCVYENPELG